MRNARKEGKGMSEYTVKHEAHWEESTGYSTYAVIAPDGSVKRDFDVRDYEYVIEAKAAAQEYANELNIGHYKKELSALQEANAQLLQQLESERETSGAAMEAQSKEIAKLRQFVRELSSYEERATNPRQQDRNQSIFLQAFHAEACTLVMQWDSATVATAAQAESEAPINWTGRIESAQPMVTKNNEVMAILTSELPYEIIAFPCTWQKYKDAILSNITGDSVDILTMRLQKDFSKSEPAYILLGIEGLEESEAKHDFVYGDKVRALEDEYEAGEYDTIHSLTIYGYVLNTYDKTETKSYYSADELELYEDESPDSRLSAWQENAVVKRN